MTLAGAATEALDKLTAHAAPEFVEVGVDAADTPGLVTSGALEDAIRKAAELRAGTKPKLDTLRAEIRWVDSARTRFVVRRS